MTQFNVGDRVACRLPSGGSWAMDGATATIKAVVKDWGGYAILDWDDPSIARKAGYSETDCDLLFSHLVLIDETPEEYEEWFK